jgi:hypothetical protein
MNRVATGEHEERRIGVVPQKELYFLPPDRRVRLQKAKVWIDSRPRSDKHVGLAQCHEGRCMQEPLRSHVMQLQAIELQQQVEKSM